MSLLNHELAYRVEDRRLGERREEDFTLMQDLRNPLDSILRGSRGWSLREDGARLENTNQSFTRLYSESYYPLAFSPCRLRG